MRQAQEVTEFLLSAYPLPYSDKYVRVADDFDRCPNCDTDLAAHVRVDEKRAGALCVRCGEEWNLLTDDEKEQREKADRSRREHADWMDARDDARDRATDEYLERWKERRMGVMR